MHNVRSYSASTLTPLSDHRSMAELFGMSESELAALIGATGTGDSASLEAWEDFVRVSGYIRRCKGDPEKFRKWQVKPNREFAAKNGKKPSPMELIRSGHVAAVAGLVRNLDTGHPS